MMSRNILKRATSVDDIKKAPVSLTRKPAGKGGICSSSLVILLALLQD